MDENKIELVDESLQKEEVYQEIRGYLIQVQNQVKSTINSSMIKAYVKSK